MKAFIAFVLILFVAIGGMVGYWGWGKWNKVENWGLALSMGSNVKEGEKERLEERYNQILDRDEILEGAVEKHDLEQYYGVSSSGEAVEKLKEDTFIELKGDSAMHVLFRGKRSSRDQREAAVRTISESFLEEVRGMTGP